MARLGRELAEATAAHSAVLEEAARLRTNLRSATSRHAWLGRRLEARRSRRWPRHRRNSPGHVWRWRSIERRLAARKRELTRAKASARRWRSEAGHLMRKLASADAEIERQTAAGIALRARERETAELQAAVTRRDAELAAAANETKRLQAQLNELAQPDESTEALEPADPLPARTARPASPRDRPAYSRWRGFSQLCSWLVRRPLGDGFRDLRSYLALSGALTSIRTSTPPSTATWPPRG